MKEQSYKDLETRDNFRTVTTAFLEISDVVLKFIELSQFVFLQHVFL